MRSVRQRQDAAWRSGPSLTGAPLSPRPKCMHSCHSGTVAPDCEGALGRAAMQGGAPSSRGKSSGGLALEGAAGFLGLSLGNYFSTQGDHKQRLAEFLEHEPLGDRYRF